MTAETKTMAERVDQLAHPLRKRPRLWGNPLVSTTPTSVSIHDLAERVEVLEEAARGSALRLERLERLARLDNGE